MKTQMCVCDHCGKAVINGYTHPGWIWFSKPMIVKKATGRKDYTNSYTTKGPEKEVEDFCSILCFEACVDNDMREMKPQHISSDFKQVIKKCGEQIKDL